MIGVRMMSQFSKKAEAEGASLRRQGQSDGTEAGGKGGSFAEAEQATRDAEAADPSDQRMTGGGERPERHGDEDHHEEAAAVDPVTPDRVGKHVADAEDGNGVTVLRGGEMQVTEDGGAENGEDAAIHIAEQREQSHGEARRPLAQKGTSAVRLLDMIGLHGSSLCRLSRPIFLRWHHAAKFSSAIWRSQHRREQAGYMFHPCNAVLAPRINADPSRINTLNTS